MKNTKIIIEPKCSPVIDSFAREISENSEIHTIIGTEENLINTIKQDSLSNSYSNKKIIALGDSEKFSALSSDITDICFSTGEIILLKESAKVYSFTEAETLFFNYVSQIINYSDFKVKNSRRTIKKLKKITKFLPEICYVFQSKR